VIEVYDHHTLVAEVSDVLNQKHEDEMAHEMHTPAERIE
jgi:hypothetical protein